METGAVSPTFLAGRLEELKRENEELREQLRRLQAQQQVSRGAILEAAEEKEAAARIAHQVTAEERATRAAVEVQGSSIGLAVVLQILSFFTVLILCIGLFVWLPREIDRQLGARGPAVTPGGAVVIPGR